MREGKMMLHCIACIHVQVQELASAHAKAWDEACVHALAWDVTWGIPRHGTLHGDMPWHGT